jgi:hypothetical protein
VSTGVCAVSGAVKRVWEQHRVFSWSRRPYIDTRELHNNQYNIKIPLQQQQTKEKSEGEVWCHGMEPKEEPEMCTTLPKNLGKR